ncbi:MAG: ArnT family glycosyltransferase [Candidatus Oleimicrobiaceae bacterium]
MLVLGVVLLAALLFRAACLPFRWVGPDEGSYLMDARLVLDGKVPIVDFAARQPLFLWSLAALFKLIGPSLVAARALLLFCSLGAGLLVYALGRRIFSPHVAIAGAAVYLLFPFTVMWSLSVITETPTALLACASAWLTLLALERKRGLWYGVCAGLAAGAAYYTRESAVWVFAVMLIYLLAMASRPWRVKLTAVAALCLGYLGACAIVWGYYARYLSLEQLLFSRLNPLDVVLSQFVRGPYSMTPTTSAAIGAVQTLDDIERYAHEILAFGLFGLVGAAVAGLLVLKRSFGTPRQPGVRLLFTWLGIVGAMYLVRFLAVEQVVFARYLLELLPALSLLFAFSLDQVLPMRNHEVNLPRVVVLLTLGVYGLQHAAWRHFPGAGAYFVMATMLGVALWLMDKRCSWRLGALFVGMAIAAVTLTFGCFKPRLPFGMQALAQTVGAISLWAAAVGLVCKSWAKNDPGRFRGLMLLTLVLFAFLYSLGKQGQKVGPSYEGIWTQAAVRQTAQVLAAQANPGDVVLSGGQIWTFAAGLHCFLDITHTLGLLYVPESTMERAFAERPPQFIIMDGYTEKRTSPHAQLLAGKLQGQYGNVAAVTGSLYPVLVYRLRDGGTGQWRHPEQCGRG